LRLAIGAYDNLTLGIALGNRSRLGLNLLLDLAPETVAVGEAALNLQSARWLRVAGVRLTSQAINNCRLRIPLVPGAVVGEEVVDEPGGGACQDCGWVGKGAGHVVEDDRLDEVGFEAIERVAQGLLRFTHHRSAHNHAGGVESDLCAIPVGV